MLFHNSPLSYCGHSVNAYGALRCKIIRARYVRFFALVRLSLSPAEVYSIL